MTKPAIEGSHKHLWDMTFQSAAKAPEYMKIHGYKSPTDPYGGILQFAFDTNLTGHEYWSSKPDTLDDFNNMMTGVRHSRPSWVEWFPVRERLLKGYQEDTVLLVDVGGAWGHDLVAFQQSFALTQELVLQDLPHVTSTVPLLPSNIKVSEYNFFKETQPVKGTGGLLRPA